MAWESTVVALPPHPPANISVQFGYTRGANFTGDIAIDQFCILQSGKPRLTDTWRAPASGQQERRGMARNPMPGLSISTSPAAGLTLVRQWCTR